METYYVNKKAQDNGDHEVHVESCRFLPFQENRQHLGKFSSCREAVREANKYYQHCNGCKFCCPTCHDS